MSEILERAADPCVAPCGILLRHPHDQAPDLRDPRCFVRIDGPSRCALHVFPTLTSCRPRPSWAVWTRPRRPSARKYCCRGAERVRFMYCGPCGHCAAPRREAAG
jgi:hypothetical protein